MLVDDQFGAGRAAAQQGYHQPWQRPRHRFPGGCTQYDVPWFVRGMRIAARAVSPADMDDHERADRRVQMQVFAWTFSGWSSIRAGARRRLETAR